MKIKLRKTLPLIVGFVFNGRISMMRILFFISGFLLLLTTVARAEERPFLSDGAHAEYLKTLQFSGTSLNTSVDDMIEHFKTQGYDNVQDMPLGLKGRNVTMRNPNAMGSSVTIMDVPSTGVRNVTIGVRSISKGKAWKDMPYSVDLQNIIDTLCSGEVEQKTSPTESIHCAESAEILYIFAHVTNDLGVKYRLNIMATGDAMLRLSYSHD